MTLPLLPTVQLGSTAITRLIVGGNPFRAYSHRSPELDAEMRCYHTPEKVLETLHHCQHHGLNSMLMRGDNVTFDIIRRFRAQGGTLHWIAQSAGEAPDKIANIRTMAEYKPVAIYLHGSETDRLWKLGQIDSLLPSLHAIHDLGLPAGLCSHMPEVLRYAVEKNWPVDFFMTCFYNISKIERQSMLSGGKFVQEPFDDPDREIACEFIRSTPKPCLAFKILGAGRKCDTPEDVRAAFEFAWARIKKNDAVVVGMMQRDMDQVAHNATIVRALA